VYNPGIPQGGVYLWAIPQGGVYLWAIPQGGLIPVYLRVVFNPGYTSGCIKLGIPPGVEREACWVYLRVLKGRHAGYMPVYHLGYMLGMYTRVYTILPGTPSTIPHRPSVCTSPTRLSMAERKTVGLSLGETRGWKRRRSLLLLFLS